MGIRVTNSMVTKNAMTNINFNKTSLSSLNTQMTTQKKISRPSDDPVIAIRALRLRNNLNQIDQYYERNIPDADNWLELTNDALGNIASVMQTMYAKCEQGANGENTTEDRKIILTELQNLSKQIYAEANADYAGRTLLSGYYTDKDVVFPANNDDAHYRISETLSVSDISKMTYITNKFKFDAGNPEIQNASTMPADCEVNRIRLAYDLLDYDAAADMKLEYRKVATGYSSARGTDCTVTVAPQGYTIKTTSNEDGTKQVVVNGDQIFKIDKTGRVIADANNDGSVSIKYNSDGNIETTIVDSNLSEGLNGANNKSITIETTVAGRQIGDVVATYEMDVEMTSMATNEDEAYTIFNGSNHIKCIAETGELILDDTALRELQSLTNVNGKEPITFTYDKTGFERYELVPEQYFDCIDLTDPANPVTHVKQSADIEYAISFNQELKVNTEASDAFNHDINRDVEELMEMISASLEADEAVNKIKSMLEDSNYANQKTELETMLEAAKRQSDIANEKVRNAYSEGVGNFQVYLEAINTQITDVGSRQNRLAIVETRMEEQQANFEELKSKNEDKDIEDIMIEYQSAYTAYQASLSATSKLAQNTLLNFL
jgi:flagellar hook-associated protein 3 FlgL